MVVQNFCSCSGQAVCGLLTLRVEVGAANAHSPGRYRWACPARYKADSANGVSPSTWPTSISAESAALALASQRLGTARLLLTRQVLGPATLALAC